MLKIGLTGKGQVMVTPANTAITMKSGDLEVFATPAMVALMEQTAAQSVAEFLEVGCGTVGILLNIQHLAATPVGMEVTCNSQLIAIDGRKLVFEVTAHDGIELIGQGRHERFIINNDKFSQKAAHKIQQQTSVK